MERTKMSWADRFKVDSSASGGGNSGSRLIAFVNCLCDNGCETNASTNKVFAFLVEIIIFSKGTLVPGDSFFAVDSVPEQKTRKKISSKN